MPYDGPSLSEWLAEFRSRRPPTEVVLYHVDLPEPWNEHPSPLRNPVASLRVSRIDDPDDPRPDRGIYLFKLDRHGQWVDDSWHEEVDDAFDQAERHFAVRRSDWIPARESD